MGYKSSNRTDRSPSARDLRVHEDESGEFDANEKDQTYLVYAQKLNNNAAMCIEIGYFEKATQSLQKALEFSQKLSDENFIEVCECKPCGQDGNIDFAADFAPADGTLAAATRGHDDELSDEEEYDSRRRNMSREDIHLLTKSISNPKVQKVQKGRQRRRNSMNACWSIEDDFCEDELNRQEEENDEIYKRPIRIQREGCSMGSTLFLIITFNLALTSHLEVAVSHSKKRFDSSSAKKALLFYEMTSDYERRILSDSKTWDPLASIRFNTILSSNLLQLLQFLPENSLPTARGLISSTSNFIDEQTELLTGRSFRKSKSSRRRDNSGGDSDRFSIRDGSDSSLSRSSHTRMPRRSSKNSTKKKGSKPNSSRSLRHALGDMAPCSRRASIS